MKNQFKATLSLIAIASLAACGGGGGDSTPAGPTGLVGYAECTVKLDGLNPEFGAAGPTTIGIQTSMTCAQVQAMVDSNIVKINALYGERNAARAEVTVALAARDAAVTETGRVAAQAAADKAIADRAVAEANIAVATAQAASLQAALDKAKAEEALAIALAQLANVPDDIVKAQAEAAAAVAARDIALANEATAKAAQASAEASASVALAARDVALADKVVADNALAIAQTAMNELNAQLVLAQAALAAAPTPEQVASLNAQVASLQVSVLALQTQVTALEATIANGGGNPTGLPFCVGTPSPITFSTTFSGVGVTCVVSYADQKAVADAIKAEADRLAALAAAVKVDGIYFSPELFMIAETDGKVWIFDQKTPDAVFGAVSVPASTGTTFSAPSKSLSFTHGDVAVVGSYVKGSSATFTMNYAGGATVSHQGTYDVAYDTPLVMPASLVMGGQDFYTGGHDLRITTSADGTSFTGASVATDPAAPCLFNGTFGATTKGYNKVTITWGANCAVPTGTVGSGVIGKYGDSYVVMTNQTGNFGTFTADVGFVAVFNPTFDPGVAPLKLGNRAKALQASRAGAR